jgi:hypothetical protein
MELATATPFEIDSALATLYGAGQAAGAKLTKAIEEIHAALGEKPYGIGRRKYWPTSTEEAVAKATELAPAAPEKKPWDRYHLPAALARYTAAEAEVQQITAKMEPLELVYRTRPWSRFFLVGGGHIHSSMACKTCNRNGQRTSFEWRPELSGHTEAEAVASLGPLLCTVCFPSAPLNWTEGVKKETCPGAGKAPQDNSIRRVGMNHYGKCTGCGDTQVITQAGVTRSHKPKKDK